MLHEQVGREEHIHQHIHREHEKLWTNIDTVSHQDTSGCICNRQRGLAAAVNRSVPHPSEGVPTTGKGTPPPQRPWVRCGAMFQVLAVVLCCCSSAGRMGSKELQG